MGKELLLITKVQLSGQELQMREQKRSPTELLFWMFLGFSASIMLVHVLYWGPVTGHIKSCFTLESVEERSQIVDILLHDVSFSAEMTHEGEAGSWKSGCSCLPELPHHACGPKHGLISPPELLLIFGGRRIECEDWHIIPAGHNLLSCLQEWKPLSRSWPRPRGHDGATEAYHVFVTYLTSECSQGNHKKDSFSQRHWHFYSS